MSFCLALCCCADPQRLRIGSALRSTSAQQTTPRPCTEEQTFDQYFEQGSFTFEREMPKTVIYDVGVTVRVWRGLHAGAAVSVFDERAARHGDGARAASRCSSTSRGRRQARLPTPRAAKSASTSCSAGRSSRRRARFHALRAARRSSRPTAVRQEPHAVARQRSLSRSTSSHSLASRRRRCART